MSGMMQQGKDGRWMDYSSGMGQYAPNYKPPAAKAINPANDPLTDANYLGGSQPWWEQKPQAPKPQLSSLQTQGLGQYSAGAGQAGSYTAGNNALGYGAPLNVPYKPDAMMMANQRERELKDFMGQRRGEVNNFLGGLSNPYGADNAGLNQMKRTTMADTARTFGAQSANANRSYAMRGINPGSGIAAETDRLQRMAAAGSQSQQLGALDAENYQRGADYDKWKAGLTANLQSELAQQEAGLKQHIASEDWAGFDRMRQQGQDALFDPLKAQGLSLNNQNQSLQNAYQTNLNQYQPRMLDQQYQAGAQGLTRGQQQIDQGGIDLRFNQQTYDQRVQAANAGYGYEAENYGGLTDMTREGRADFNAVGARNLREAERNPWYTGMRTLNNLPVQVMEKYGPMAANITGRFLIPGS